MAGQIIKRAENTWLVRIFMGRDARGKRLYLNKTIRGTKKNAQQWLTAKLRDKDIGLSIQPASMSLNEYLDKWLKEAACPRLREATFDSYEIYLQKHIRPKLGAKRLADIKPLDLQAVINEMTGNGYAPRTVRYAHTILYSALKQAVRWQMLSMNPCEAVELPRQARTEMKAFSPAEARTFLEAAKGNKHGLVLAFALATGMRPEEYLSLKWSDIDFSKGTATVQRTLIWRKGGGWYFGEPKTSKSRRTVPLPANVLTDLQTHRREQSAAMLQLGAAYERNDLVFTADGGKPLYYGHLTKRHFYKILEKAELPRIRLYDLRHTCATLLLVAGINPKIVSERLGHSSITLTLDIYTHVLPDMQREATDKLSTMLYG
jgi:integrase